MTCMARIQVLDKTFEPYIAADAIDVEIKRMGEELSRDYAGKTPVFIAILNGSFMFASDLFKAITIPAEICFVKLASYEGTSSTGKLVTAIGLTTDIRDRDVVILEDIIDTGMTLSKFIPELEAKGPRSIRVCALLHKKEATTHPVEISYLGFTIPDRFVLGYGLDYDGLGRNLKEIYQLVE